MYRRESRSAMRNRPIGIGGRRFGWRGVFRSMLIAPAGGPTNCSLSLPFFSSSSLWNLRKRSSVWNLKRKERKGKEINVLFNILFTKFCYYSVLDKIWGGRFC